MDYQHKILLNHPRKQVYKFETPTAYIPNVEDTIIMPNDWKEGCIFKVTSVHHYPVEKLIIINVNKMEITK
jgi:hypothetical protein